MQTGVALQFQQRILSSPKIWATLTADYFYKNFTVNRGGFTFSLKPNRNKHSVSVL